MGANRFSHEKESVSATDKILLYCGIALFAFFCIWNVYYLPMNMDEALIYHRLACDSHPFSFLHTLRESCDNLHELTTFFGLKMARPYAYVGPLQGMLYAPVYYAFNSMYAQYWFALPFFLLFAWLMARETGNPRRSFPIFLVCLPLVLKFIHDDGVLKVMAVTFPLAAMATRKLLNSEKALQYVYAFLLAAIVLMNIVDKIYFLYLFPSFVFFCLALAGDENWEALLNKIKKAFPAIACAGAILAIVLVIHLLSDYGGGEVYYKELIKGSPSKQPFEALLGNFMSYVFFWPSYAHRSLNMDYFSSAAVLFFTVLSFSWFVLCVGLGVKTQKGEFKPISLRTTLLLSSLIAMVVVFVVSRNVWAAHHFMYLWIPILMLVADLVSKLRHQWALAVVGGFFALNLLALFYMMEAPISQPESKGRDAVFEYLEKAVPAEKSIVNFSSWGGYYIYALYAPKNQLVTYTEPLRPEDAGKLANISNNTGRKIYNVCLGMWCNEFYLNQVFNNQLKFKEALPGSRTWKVYVGEPVTAGK